MFAVIVFVALSLRLTYVLVAKSGPCKLVVHGVVVGTYHSQCTGPNDQVNYNSTANALALGQGLSSPIPPHRPLAEHPPVTTFVLGAVSFAFDHLPLSKFADETIFPLGSKLRTHVREHRLFMALLGTVNVALVFVVAQRLCNRRVATIAGWTGTLYPFLWVNDGLIMSETIAIFVVLLLLLAVQLELRRHHVSVCVWIGILCGIAALTRAELLLLAPIFACIIAWRRGIGARAQVARGAIVLALASCVVLPWSLYNSSRFARTVTISTNDGITLAGANCAPTYSGHFIGLWSPEPPCTFTNRELASFGAVDSSVIAAQYRHRGIEYMRSHLTKLPVVVAARVGRLWNVFRPLDMVDYNVGESRERWVTTLGLISYFAMLPFALLGAASMWRAKMRRQCAALLAPVFVVTLSAAALVGQTRLRAPAEPVFVILTAVGVVEAERAIARRRVSRQSS